VFLSDVMGVEVFLLAPNVSGGALKTLDEFPEKPVFYPRRLY